MRYEPHSTIDFGTGVTGSNPATGNALEVSGDHVIIGDQGYNGRDGRVFVYKWNAGNLELHQTLSKGNGLPGNGWFGYALDVSGDWLVVSTTHQTGWASPSGAEGGVECFKRNTLTDEWQWQQSVIGPDSASTDEFGLCVMVSGNWMIVGAPYRDNPVSNCGKIYFYELVNGVWTYRQAFQEDTPTASNTFGLAVEIDGEWAFAHTYAGAAGNGAMLCYRLTAGTWSLHQTITLASPISGGAFGRPMRCDGNRLVAGCSLRGSNFGLGGYVVFFELNESNQWIQTDIKSPPMLLSQSWFPNNLAISGRFIVAGSLFSDRSNHRTADYDPAINGSNGDGKGRTVVYEQMTDGTWATHPIQIPNLNFEDWSGSSVAVSPDGEYIYSLAFGTNVRATMRLHVWKFAKRQIDGLSADSVSA